MFKNILLIALGAGIAILVLGLAGIAWAQTQTPPNGLSPNSVPYGGMGRWNSGGMMGRWNQSGETGFMHDYFIAAIAPKLNLTVDSLEAELTAGKTLWQIAEEKGISIETFQSLMFEAKQEALSQMVADGVITQDQADWMLSRMKWMWENGRGFGSGFGPCHGGSWGSPRGRWAPTPTPGTSS
ncbi:MAG: hypothetical protein Kow0088_09200 [Anaerolineales bacterium]